VYEIIEPDWRCVKYIWNGKQICATLCELTEQEYVAYDEFDKQRQQMIELCDAYATEENLLHILVDGIDQLIEDEYREIEI